MSLAPRPAQAPGGMPTAPGGAISALPRPRTAPGDPLPKWLRGAGPRPVRTASFRSSCRSGPAERPAGRRAPPAAAAISARFSSSSRFCSRRCKVSARRRASPELRRAPVLPVPSSSASCAARWSQYEISLVRRSFTAAAVLSISASLAARTSARCSGTTSATAYSCAACSRSRSIQAPSGRSRNASTAGSSSASGR